MSSLTAHLLQLDIPSLTRATQHPFLIAAATSALPLDSLQQWLAQDRLYALAYVNFIGTLLARCRISSAAGRTQTAHWRVADLLIDCLINIRRELQLFDDTAAAEGWLEKISDPTPARATRAYQDLFAGSTAQGRPLLVGLVVLWATEACYLRSWRYAKQHVDQDAIPGSAEGVMQRVFIPNWSSVEFEQFVDALENVVTSLCEDLKLEKGGWLWQECEVAFRQVLWTEEMFWPNVSTEGRLTS